MIREAFQQPHIYRDIMVRNYDVHRLKNADDVHIGERGIGIMSGQPEVYREQMFGSEGLHLEYTCFQDGCSGGMQVEYRPRMNAWEVNAYLNDRDSHTNSDIFYIRYGLDGRLLYAVVNVESPGAPQTLGTIKGDGLALLETTSPYSAKPIDHTQLTLSAELDSEGYTVYRPAFYTRESPWNAVEIPQSAWYKDSAVLVEHDGRKLMIDWTHPHYIEVTAVLPENITKYGRFPKYLNTQDITLFSKHLDQAHFPTDQFIWKILWGSIVAGRIR